MNKGDGVVAERRIFLTDSWDNETAILEARSMAALAGFGKAEQALISTVASELSTNILRYAGNGEMIFRVIKDSSRTGIEIRAVDTGPGIKDIERAMEDNFTTTKGSLGLGLPSVKRIMDDFIIESSPEQGTRIVSCKWKKDVRH